MRLAPLVALIFASAALRAQPVPGTCSYGSAEATLRLSGLEAAVFNTGSLFFGGTRTNGDGYFIPRGERKSPLFAAALWLGGTVGGQLRVAAGRYTNFNFWPGPLGSDARPVNPADCSAYDRIYTVSREDIAAYLGGATPTADLRDWPAHLGAPVLDGDGVEGNYSLAGGDQPALRGDVASWWLMNDAGNAHTGTQQFPVGTETPPLGVEVRVEAYGFNSPTSLNRTTFYRYTVTNRTAEPIEEFYAGLFMDTDLGNAVDDFVGTDTTSGMAYTYNADDNDEGQQIGYGIAPPAIGLLVASGPVGRPNGRDDDRDGRVDEPGERLRLTSSSYYIGGSSVNTTGDPISGLQHYRYLKGLWADGSAKRAFGDGYNQTQGQVTPFAFPGDPVTRQPWSETNNGTAAPINATGDRRLMGATGPFRLEAGQSETITFAVPYTRGASNLDSVTQLRNLAAGIRNLFVDGDLEASRVAAPVPPPASDDVRIGLPSPNPFLGRTVVRYEMPTGTRMRATLHDALGRRLAVLHDGPVEAPTGEIEVDGSALAAGVYRVRVTVPGAERVVTLVRR